jgi:hypothetical protein
MSIIPLILAGLLIGFSLLYIVLKTMIAYDHCSGGAPLLDGYVFPPVFLGIGSAILFRKFQISVSGFVVALASFVLLFAIYQVAWRLGTRRKR